MHINSLFLCDIHTLGSTSNWLPKHNGPAALTTQLEESLNFNPGGQLINTNTPPRDANDQLNEWYDTQTLWMIDKTPPV